MMRKWYPATNAAIDEAITDTKKTSQSLDIFDITRNHGAVGRATI